LKPKRPQSLGTEGAADRADSQLNPTTTVAHSSSPAVPVRDQLGWSLDNIAVLTTFSRRLLERELAAGRMPRPDIRIGRRCLWKPASILAWLDSLADRQKAGSRP
jgi:hypothetical protein